jgi:hypothetical protein
LDDEDLYESKPPDEHILRYLMHRQIKGATMFRGYMGFGARHHLHAPGKIAASDALPVMILFVDEEANVREILPHLKQIVSEGLIIAHKVERI